MSQPFEETSEVTLVERIASAIRNEFGDEDFDDFPGFRDATRAGQVNRAYRTAAGCILTCQDQEASSSLPSLTDALNLIARRRLETGGLDAAQIALLLRFEPPGRADWLAYLILTSWPGIERLLADCTDAS